MKHFGQGGNPTAMTSAMERVIRGRVGLITREPFFGMLALDRLTLVEDPKAETHWVNGRQFGFNPEWSLKTPIGEIETALAHQVLTCALGHPFRRGARDAKLWNEASDTVVNLELKKAGFSLPDDAQVDPNFEGKYAEEIYATLKLMQPDPEEEGGGKGDNQRDFQSGPGGGGPDYDTRDKEGQDAPANSMGEVRDAPGGEDGDEANEQPASAAKMAEQEADWQTSVAQAAQAARGAGKLSGDMERNVSSMLNAKVAWQEALQRLILSRAKDDYSWAKPNRRLLPFGVYAPSMDSPRCGVLAFAVDGSGSITQTMFDQAAAEVEAARDILKPEKVVVLLFDTAVRQVDVFHEHTPIEIKMQGGGGTRFDEPIRILDELGVTPEVLVYLTDLDSTVFAPEPAYPVIWVSTSKTVAPYGDVIKVN